MYSSNFYLVSNAAAEKDLQKYNSLVTFIDAHLNQNGINDGFGVRILQFCINQGNERMGIPKKMLLNIDPTQTNKGGK